MKHIFIRGNSKLGKDVLVFNLPPKTTCRPTPWCLKHCYAMKGLHLYPNVKVANAERKDLADRDDFADLAIKELNNSVKPYVRIHSSGDFYSADYVDKWVKICSASPTKKFLVFTKRTDLIEPLKKLARLPNVSVYESLDESKQKPKTQFLRAMVDGCTLSTQRAANKRSRETIHCPGECGPCGHACWDKNKHVIFPKH